MNKKTNKNKKFFYEAFAKSYIIDYIGSSALRRLGVKGSNESLSVQATRLLNRPEVQSLVAQAQAEVFGTWHGIRNKMLGELADISMGKKLDGEYKYKVNTILRAISEFMKVVKLPEKLEVDFKNNTVINETEVSKIKEKFLNDKQFREKLEDLFTEVEEIDAK